MEFQASTDAMIIDVDTAKHVELLSSSMSKKKESSLYGVLNKCSTPGGSKLLRATLFQPPIKVNLFLTFDFIQIIEKLNMFLSELGGYHRG